MGARQSVGRSASGQRDARRETLDRIARRRASWAKPARSTAEACCARCRTLYTEHDLVLSPWGRVCESCEGALEVARVGRLNATGSLRLGILGVFGLFALHACFSLGHVSQWAFVWGASLGGLWALAEGALHLARHRHDGTTALKAETEAPPWWGAFGALGLSAVGVMSLAAAVLV